MSATWDRGEGYREKLRGDPMTRECGARTRPGRPCQRLGNERNGRCHLHGGWSTGPRTEEGRIRQREAVTKHGYYTKEAIEERKLMRAVLSGGSQMPIPDTTLLGPSTPEEIERVRELKQFREEIEEVDHLEPETKESMLKRIDLQIRAFSGCTAAQIQCGIDFNIHF